MDQRVTVSLCVAVSMHLIGSVLKRESSIDTALELGLLLVNGYLLTYLDDFYIITMNLVCAWPMLRHRETV